MAARYTTAGIIRALEQSRGLIEVAAAALGCDPGTIRRRMKSNPEVGRAVEDGRAALVDLAEQRLAEAVDRGEPWAVSLTVRTLGRGRGWGDSVAVTAALDVNHTDTTPQQRIEARLAAMRERIMAQQFEDGNQ